MPTDAELRTLFRESPAPDSRIDTSAVIRRSRRRRLPQQLGVGSVLTLAVAGIGFASFTGLQGVTPSMTAADAPAGVAESDTFSGTDMTSRSTCAADTAADGVAIENVEVVVDVPSSARVGETVHGTLTLTNTGTQPVDGTVVSTAVSLTGGREEISQRDDSSAGTNVSLPPGGTTSIDFAFNTGGCDVAGEADRAPLDPGSYDLVPSLTVEAADGTLWRLDGAASAITIR